MDRMDFTQGVVRTRVLEKRLLSRAQIDRMIDADSIEEVFRILGETEYAGEASKVQNFYNYEKVLSNELSRVYHLMREISVDPKIIDLLTLKYDYHNLKVMIKEKELNEDFSYLYLTIGTDDFKEVKKLFLDGSLNEMKKEYQEAIETVQKDFAQSKDPGRIDMILDRYYFKHLHQLAADTKIPLFTDYVKDMIDFINVKTAIRLKRQGRNRNLMEEVILPGGNIGKDSLLLILNDSIEDMMQKLKDYRISTSLLKGLESYEKTNRLTDFEKYMDDYLMNLNKSSKYITFGPEPIFSYVVAKETEIKNLRIIMVSKTNGISPEAIRERVRDLYV
jgi:V/A-type H+-transporting ATPase subunit C